MKREILFRAKRADSGEWVYGSLVDSENECNILSICKNAISKNNDHWSIDKPCYKVDPETVGQLTGLTDKYGVKIFEGDIISLKDCSNNIWTKDGAVVIHSNEYVGGWVISSNGHNLNIGMRTNKIKVIGNEFDNPELLK